MLSSLASVPTVPLGMEKRLACFDFAREVQADTFLRRIPALRRRCPAPRRYPAVLPARALRIDARLCQRLGRGRQRQRHHARNMLALVRVHPRQFVETGDFSCDLYGKIRSIEAADALYAARAGKYGVTEVIMANAVGLTTPMPVMTTRFFMNLLVMQRFSADMQSRTTLPIAIHESIGNNG